MRPAHLLHLVLLSCVAGCHPPPIATVRREADETMRRRAEAAVDEAFRARALVPLDVAPITLVLPSFLACGPRQPDESELARLGGPRPEPGPPPPTTRLALGPGSHVIVETCAFLEFLRGTPASISGSTDDGARITLVLARPVEDPLGIESRLGVRSGRDLVIVRPVREHSGDAVVGYAPGSCDHMPDPGIELWNPASADVLVLDGARFPRAELVPVPFRPIHVTLRCDENTY